MSIELDRPGMGVTAFALSVSTLLALKKNARSPTMSWLLDLGRVQP
jgi:hypothetical protein